MVSSKVPDGIRPQSSFFFVSLDKESGVFFLICDLSFWKHPYMFKWGCHVLEKGGPCEKLPRNSRRSSDFY